jgi:excisionase family DNA binding protein
MNDKPSLTLRELVNWIADTLDDRLAERLDTRAEQQRSPWMTVNEAADYLRWPKTRLYKLTRANAIPCRRHQGRILFHRDELDGWLDGYREGPPPPPRRAPASAPTVGRYRARRP